ncbi:MAG: PTS system mannose/fructose/N-acetylgalactosamine-transporter subunit IIB [bacterium]
MAIELVRIDDRLIHGQVIVGWCPHIKPDRLILCSDEVAKNDWERAIYEDAAADYQISICTVEETAKLLRSEELEQERIFLIVDSPRIVVELLNLSVKISKVNVGGMHYDQGKRQIAPFLFVNDIDLNYFRILKNRNVVIEARDVPSCKSINVTELLGL